MKINPNKIHITRLILKDNQVRTEYLNQDMEWASWTNELFYPVSTASALKLRHKKELFEGTQTFNIVKNKTVCWCVGYSKKLSL